jgi:hypothetical protein
MKENVGRTDRIVRFLVGPAIVGLGFAPIGGHLGRIPGLVAMIAGVLVVESAITRVCPLNALLGLDTRNERERTRDLQELQADARLRAAMGHPARPLH